jgi:sigma-E factor negative regulatory protein RseA
MKPQHTSDHPAAHHNAGDFTADALCLLSARMDGEAADSDWLGVLESPDGQAAWHQYHLIGEALRATASQPFVASVVALSATHAQEAATQVVRKARAAGLVDAGIQPEHSAQVLTFPQPTAKRRSELPRAEAANDGVFRWKMVAGLASVVAVLGVVWGVAGVPGAVGSGAELALKQGPAGAGGTQVASVVAPANGVAVVNVLVATPNGAMLRDPRLEALLQAHRQAGGASALQVPAGFLRNATYQSAQR